MASKAQHPHGNQKGAGLSVTERSDWDRLRVQFHKERAKAELIRRGLMKEK